MDLKIIAQEIREIIKEKQKELELTFEEDAHKYTMKDLDGKVRSDFPSVSKVMKLFYDEFPTEEAAYKKAKGDPYEAQQLMEEWAKAGTTSTNMGSRVHFELETETLSMFNVKKEVRQPVYECDMEMTMKGDRMINAGKKFLKLIWLMFNKEKTGFGFVVTDWKTNKQKNMETNNFTKPMKRPFEKLPNNALGHYYTQLPFYAKLLLKMLEGTKYENLKFYGGVIVHLTDEMEFVEYRIPKEVFDTILSMDIKQYLTK